MGLVPMLILFSPFFFFSFVLSSAENAHGDFPTTLQGPFPPVTVPLDNNTFHGNAVDLPESDPQIRKTGDFFQPEQISVSLSSDYDSVWISWVTEDYQIGDDITPLDPESVLSVVYYGIFESRKTYQATGYSLVYNQLYPYYGLQNYTSGIIHHVQLTGLKPGTLYQYQCGDPSIPLMSDVYYFRTRPVSNRTEYPRKIAVVGDLGLTYNTTETLGHLLSNHPDLVILVGGFSYADTYLANGTESDCYSCSQTPIQETYQPRWDYWFMQPLLANVPTMTVGGRHEIERQAGNQIFASYSSRFAFPAQECGSSSPLYYSFNAGGVHFVVLSAYIPYDKSSDQYTWLEADLYNVDRNRTWLVVSWYPSWYSTFKDYYREAECMRTEIEDLLYEYNVDIVYNAHVHAYERSNRVYNYSLDPCGPVYIMVGDGGTKEPMSISHADDTGCCPEPSSTGDEEIGGFCGFNFTSGPAAGMFCWDKQPEYSAYRESSYGHGILEVKNETHALWSWHRNQEYYKIARDIVYIVREPERCLVNRH